MPPDETPETTEGLPQRLKELFEKSRKLKEETQKNRAEAKRLRETIAGHEADRKRGKPGK